MPPYNSINLHPSSHAPSSLKNATYDVICIGSGWAGRVIGARLVKAGYTAVVVEEELVGGDCPFWACVPSKALLRPLQALEEAKAVTGVKERLNSANGVDVHAVFARRDAFTSKWNDADRLVPLVENSGADLVRGVGRLTGVKKVSVQSGSGDKIELEAKLAVALCSGSVPMIPNIPGLAEVNPWGPRQATSASEVPEHLIVLGAGAVGCEMSAVYASFGGKVSLVCIAPEVLPRMDPEAGKLVRGSLESQGVKIHLSTEATKVHREANGSVKVELSTGETIQGTEILVAAGRKARTNDMGLEQFGLKTDGTPLPVNESLLVDSVPGDWLYAAGDINGRAPLTHSCKYHGKIAANAIIAKAKGINVRPREYDNVSATADHTAVPQVVFTNPNAASVGLTRTRAQKEGRAFREVTAPVVSVGAMLHAEGYKAGWAQWIVEEQTNKLLGATLVGDDVAELIHPSTVAIVGGLTLEQLTHAIPAFPTLSEVYLNLVDAAGA
ncbi:dihydrolipoyl dehydrogenase [Rhizodiscina lignyota]|uniref:Dihydrolipoyl dehydrogenase n=1 Tax=Rhizodiscina lignyota TaxID=1504668 RepID=A0A9P4IBQ9_9PEZI|nr:dihydrolipoyl dehydrogenase [Rhizodiscina lignyota]